MPPQSCALVLGVIWEQHHCISEVLKLLMSQCSQGLFKLQNTSTLVQKYEHAGQHTA